MTLREELGKALTPQEVADLFGIDARTVRKYSERLGGVEVAPGCLRFFENRIREIVYADANNSTRQVTVARGSENRGEDSGLKMVRPGRKRAKSGHFVGGKDEGGTGEAERDPHNLLESIGMGEPLLERRKKASGPKNLHRETK
jgi:hypothetical protein